MKKARMKGKNVEEATKAALEVLSATPEESVVNVINEGKPGMFGVIGGDEAEVEVIKREGAAQDAKDLLQELLDKMQFVTLVEAEKDGDIIQLNIKGEDMGRIIGKEGATLKAIETVVRSMSRKVYPEGLRISLDADGYKDKRKQALERLATDIVAEVVETGREKELPPMEPADRRIIHILLQENAKVTTFSKGEGRARRLVVAPR
jgi:spoIIIJ-associated protein